MTFAPTDWIDRWASQDQHEQLHFLGHDDDITALDMHPNKVIIVTGQIGKDLSLIHI